MILNNYYFYTFICRDVVTGLEEFIKTDKELLVHILINMRAFYTGYLQSSDPKTVGLASVDGTLLSVIDEVNHIPRPLYILTIPHPFTGCIIS